MPRRGNGGDIRAAAYATAAYADNRLGAPVRVLRGIGGAGSLAPRDLALLLGVLAALFAPIPRSSREHPPPAPHLEQVPRSLSPLEHRQLARREPVEPLVFLFHLP